MCFFGIKKGSIPDKVVHIQRMKADDATIFITTGKTQHEKKICTLPPTIMGPFTTRVLQFTIIGPSLFSTESLSHWRKDQMCSPKQTFITSLLSYWLVWSDSHRASRFPIGTEALHEFGTKASGKPREEMSVIDSKSHWSQNEIKHIRIQVQVHT